MVSWSAWGAFSTSEMSFHINQVILYSLIWSSMPWFLMVFLVFILFYSLKRTNSLSSFFAKECTHLQRHSHNSVAVSELVLRSVFLECDAISILLDFNAGVQDPNPKMEKLER